VVGASLGAAVALELALTAPERVRSLTLITPFVVADARLRAVCDAWRQLAAEVAPESVARMLLPWFFSAIFLEDEMRRRRVLRGLATTVAKVPAASLARSSAGLHAWSGSRVDELSRVKVPTLVVVAGADLITPNAAAIAEGIRGARCCVVSEAGHAVAIEAPGAVTEAITAHLAAAS
jgi:pimeloyl-ACP methyl ester carboxylesterase